MLGDEPADLVTGALRRAAEERRALGRPAPTLQELLDATEAALASRRGELIADAPHGLRVTARAGGREVAADGRRAEPALAAILVGTLEAVAAAYRARWRRLPRLRELLDSIAFVIGGIAGEVLADGAHLQLEAITGA